MRRVFISYQMTHDAPLATAVCEGFEGTGFADCFLAERDMAGGLWGDQLRERITSADCVVPVISAAVDDASYVKVEVELALDAEVLVVPIVTPGAPIPVWRDYMLHSLQNLRVASGSELTASEVSKLARLISAGRPPARSSDVYEAVCTVIEDNWERFNRGEHQRCAAAYLHCALSVCEDAELAPDLRSPIQMLLDGYQSKDHPLDPFGAALRYSPRSLATDLREAFESLLDSLEA